MAFDLENAVQQGFNRDVTTNDFNVRANNLEVALGDAGGTTEFKVLDSDNVAVVVADSDGYLSIAGDAEIHGGHVLIKGESQANTPFITLEDEVDNVDVYLFNQNPDGAITGAMGSFGTNYTDGYMYINTDGATDWQRLAYYSQLTGATTLHQAYKNDTDGSDATITTDATDGDVVITGTEQFRVTTDAGVDVDTIGAVTIAADLDSSISVDNANLTFEVVGSGDIINRLAAPGSDFVIDQGAGSEYLRAETSVNELRLGDTSPTLIDVRVLSNMVVDGDFTVNGTTTYVNTENLYVEDRLLRLNVGAAPSFSGTTGLEMEVGSDGYVEFHWDDTQSRWEFSIDRTAAPEAQTFRPIPYLADSPGTLDLSSTGTGGFPTLQPNPDAGASVINTNATNFPYTFGDYMYNDSVQSALEAIDAYFIDLSAAIYSSSSNTTLHQAYKNDADGSDATITTDATDGSVVIAGTQSLWVTATSGINLDAGFDMDATSAFDVDLTGAAFTMDSDTASTLNTTGANLSLTTTTSGDVVVNAASNVDVDGSGVTIDATGAVSIDAATTSNFSVSGGDLTLSASGTVDVDGAAITLDATTSVSLDAGAASNFTTTAGSLTLDGAGGVVLDGNGSNVIPATNNTDSLGNSTNGWTDIFLNNSLHGGAVVGLNDVGSALVHNSTAGADLVGTNSLNFSTTFGPDMVENTVQAALEAIDGYLQYLTIGISQPVTLQIAYENDANGGDAIITTDSVDGSLVIAGTESLWVTTANGINLDAGFDMDATSSFDVDVTGAGFHLDAYGSASNISVDAADLVVSTTSTGKLTLAGATGIVLDGNGFNVIPADSCTDSLGDSTHGWSDVYICKNGTPIAIQATGGPGNPNTTSGAAVVGTNAANFTTFGPDMFDNSVQSALQAIDGYFQDLSLDSMDTTYLKKVGLDINGGVLNGVTKVTTIAGTPGLAFSKSGTSRASWAIPVPSDWDGTSDFAVTAIWSPKDSSAGNVEWRLEYKVLALTELVSTASTNVDYAQAAGGTADALQSTVSNLLIPASAIQTTDSLIVINLVRRGDAAGDTYGDDANVHLMHYNYYAQNIV